ncbi:transposase [Lysinibacillus agricola]|uniref:Transposase n=1 Tax=Lysinibacillus agricola TaxID=2590012 RepID=A0ABX7AP92_9BACI|nr:transposase [Lysinibacillus agricola]
MRNNKSKKINRRAVKSGKVPKQVVRDLAGITIYISNLPEWISARQIVELYRLRWQVELTFKSMEV